MHSFYETPREPCMHIVLSSLLIIGFRHFDSKCIERIPCIFFINSISDPLRDNLLFTLIDRTSRMLCKAIVHQLRLGVNVAKENCIALYGFYVNTRITKVCTSSLCGKCAVHHHGCHSCTELVRKASAVSIAVRGVSVRFRVIQSSSKVLNRHEIFLSIFLDIKSQDVIGVVVHSSRKLCNVHFHTLFIVFLIPLDLDTSLHGFTIVGHLRTPLAVGHSSTMQGL
mmetsp:Transcript_10265/g.18675  ORF Transcript_10265/g.18675 Transcript_10265/m.18675 type:complete len:225 (-) Transcript_10265:772-1446(-)